MTPYIIIALAILITAANVILTSRNNKLRQQWRREMDELAARRANPALTKDEAERIRDEWTRKHGKPA